MQIDSSLVLGLQALDGSLDAADVAKLAQKFFGERRGSFFGAPFVPGLLDFRDVAAKPITGELLGIEGAHSGRVEGDGASVSGAGAVGIVGDGHVTGSFYFHCGGRASRGPCYGTEIVDRPLEAA